MSRTDTIRRLNDALRQDLVGGRILITVGIQELPSGMRHRVLQAVRAFDAFTPDNDPHEEHDFGAVEIEGRRCFWKIDYYDLALEGGSPDPTDPAVTSRVMTIMLASEY